MAIFKNFRLSEWFRQEPPLIRFADSSFMVANLIYEVPRSSLIPFDPNKVEIWDWTGANIRKESQGLPRDPHTVQFRVIERLKSSPQPYDVIFDDDDKGEAADVVAIRAEEERIVFELYHCKFSGGARPGQRVKDLYEVCGQAQKSVTWREDTERLFRHLQSREAYRQQKHSATRYEVGSDRKLVEIETKIRFLHCEFRVFIVQPGLSAQQLETDQLELLAATELYLMETYAIKFGVIGSS